MVEVTPLPLGAFFWIPENHGGRERVCVRYESIQLADGSLMRVGVREQFDSDKLRSGRNVRCDQRVHQRHNSQRGSETTALHRERRPINM